MKVEEVCKTDIARNLSIHCEEQKRNLNEIEES